jgi:alpha-beta hydrolase superfamily lysophospholipase
MIVPKLAMSLLLAAPAAPVHPELQYLLLSTRDTVAVERVHAEQGRLQGELIVRAAGLRVVYELALADGRPRSMDLSAWLIAAADTAPPLQSAHCEFYGDSVSVLAGGRPQHFGGVAGAWPYANPSMAMISLALQHADLARRDTTDLHFFLLSAGSVATAHASRLGRDSVRVRLAGVEMRLATDASGAITGGVIPSQGIRIETGAATALARPAPTDYSAPADAPYTAETVHVPVTGHFDLVGTLTRPKTTRPVPCIVTITGSGLEDRDEALPIVPGYRPFRQIADALGRRGIATLRLDDRGFGESRGDATQETSADIANDIRAGLAWLRTRPDIDARRLALLGHSEGGLIAPMIAAKDPTIRAIVLLAAPARTGRRVVDYQQREAIARDTTLDAAARERRGRKAKAELDSLAVSNAWLRYFLDYDPLIAAKQVKVPVLVLQGANDRQVEAAQADELAAAMRSAGNRDVTVAVLPGLNHLFLPDPSGDPMGYARLKEHEIRPDVLQRISDWLVARLR